MVELKIAVIIMCAGLKLWGELAWHDAQRFILPIVYSAYVSYGSGCWWLGITTLPMIAPIDLAYKDYGKSNGFDRGMWLFAICVMAGLGPTILGHLSLFWFIPFCLLSGVIGATLRNVDDLIEAPIDGAYIVALCWFIHK